MKYLVPKYNEQDMPIGEQFVERDEAVRILAKDIRRLHGSSGLTDKEHDEVVAVMIDNMYEEFEGNMVPKSTAAHITIGRAIEALPSTGRCAVISMDGVHQF